MNWGSNLLDRSSSAQRIEIRSARTFDEKAKSAPLLGTLLVLAIFAVAVWLLVDSCRGTDLTLRRFVDSLLEIPLQPSSIALGVTIINYAVILVCYDYLAFRFAKVPISLKRVAFAALTSYPFSYNFGATLAVLLSAIAFIRRGASR